MYEAILPHGVLIHSNSPFAGHPHSLIDNAPPHSYSVVCTCALACNTSPALCVELCYINIAMVVSINMYRTDIISTSVLNEVRAQTSVIIVLHTISMISLWNRTQHIRKHTVHTEEREHLWMTRNTSAENVTKRHYKTVLFKLYMHTLGR